ncbi:MAG: nucleotidyltransferase family protein, partial [Victivallaceae bacterium]
MGAQLSQTQIVLLKILACSLKNQKYTSEDFVDYWELYNESSSQTVLLQTISALDTEKISDAEIRKKWTNAALNQLGMNLKIHSQHGYVHKVMRDNDIDYCILKGSASASFYPRPLLRTMGDVDFLVRESDILRGEGAFRRDGFMPWQEQHECHVVLRKDNVLLEMHFAPAGMPAGKNGKIIAEYLDDIFSKTELITVENTTFLRPSSFHHGLILLMHIYHHLLEEGIGLRHLCDWALWI